MVELLMRGAAIVWVGSPCILKSACFLECARWGQNSGSQVRTGSASEKAQLGWDRGARGEEDDGFQVGGEPVQSLLSVFLLQLGVSPVQQNGIGRGTPAAWGLV